MTGKKERKKQRNGSATSFQVRKKSQKNGPEQSLSLINLRQQIDRIDEKILDLLDRRLALAISTIKTKNFLRDKQREKEIIAQLKTKVGCSSYLTFPFIKKIYDLIFDQSLALEKRYLKEQKNKGMNIKQKGWGGEK